MTRAVATALVVEGLAKSYGGVRALAPITASFDSGTITAVVGANGAGKTTFLDCLSGRVPATSGNVVLHGQPLGSLPPEGRARRGMARLFQDATLFHSLLVREVLELAFDSLGRTSLWPALVSRRLWRERRTAVDTALNRFNLEQVEHELLAHLSLGMSRVVALAALELSGADVWLLDEPASGLSRAEVDRLGGLLRSLAHGSQARCIVLVEHDAGLVQAAADRIVLLERGALVADAIRGSEAWDDVIAGRASGGRPLSTTTDAPAEPVVGGKDSGSVLAGHELTVSYGKFTAVRDVSLEARTGEIRCLVGTNGAGKSTIMRCLVGLLQPNRGNVTLDGSLLDAPPHVRAQRHGIVLVAGGRTVFPHLSVNENLRLAGMSGEADDVLGIFPELRERQRQLAGSLSGGEQQMLAIARALLLEPRFLLVDELTLGLAESAAQRLLEALTRAREVRGLGVLLVEQDYALALAWSTHAYVMAQGELLFAGPAGEAAARRACSVRCSCPLWTDRLVHGRMLFVGAVDALDERCLAAVRARGIEVVCRPVVLAEELTGFTVLSVKLARDLRPEPLAAAPDLNGIALRSRDLRALDPSIRDAGHVIQVLEGPPEPVAEFALALLIAVWRLPSVALPMAAGRCPPPRNLSSATLGVVGLGRIGRLVAARAARLGMRVRGWDRVRVGLEGVDEVSLDELLEHATILSLHLPLEPATRQLIGAAHLSRLPRGSILVNTARAGILDEAAVLHALDSGQLAAAALDVAPWDDEWGATDAEIDMGRRLREHPLVCATPHVAYATAESESVLSEQFADGVQTLLASAAQRA